MYAIQKTMTLRTVCAKLTQVCAMDAKQDFTTPDAIQTANIVPLKKLAKKAQRVAFGIPQKLNVDQPKPDVKTEFQKIVYLFLDAN